MQTLPFPVSDSVIRVSGGAVHGVRKFFAKGLECDGDALEVG